jgi:hypothetical protein
VAREHRRRTLLNRAGAGALLALLRTVSGCGAAPSPVEFGATVRVQLGDFTAGSG